MGVLIQSGLRVHFPDVALLHVQAVFVVKLRRQESFYFSWKCGQGAGGGRQSMWCSPPIPVVFQYSQRPDAPLDAEWARRLLADVNESGELVARDAQGCAVKSTAEASTR